MSRNHIESVSNELGNIHQIGTIFRVVVAVAGLAATTMSNEKYIQNEHFISGVVGAIQENKKTFQGLPIIRIGNPEEIRTLKSSGKDGLYIFQEGNTVTYWKIQSGIVESDTYTLNR